MAKFSGRLVRELAFFVFRGRLRMYMWQRSRVLNYLRYVTIYILRRGRWISWLVTYQCQRQSKFIWYIMAPQVDFNHHCGSRVLIFLLSILPSEPCNVAPTWWTSIFVKCSSNVFLINNWRSFFGLAWLMSIQNISIRGKYQSCGKYGRVKLWGWFIRLDNHVRRWPGKR